MKFIFVKDPFSESNAGDLLTMRHAGSGQQEPSCPFALDLGEFFLGWAVFRKLAITSFTVAA